MKNLLYIGNKLASEKTNITTIDTLGNLLANEGYNVKFASDKQSKGIRLLDMLFAVLRNRKKVDYVLIDTYSTLNFYYAFFVSQLCRVFSLKYIPILHGGDLPRRLQKSPKKSKLIFDYAYRCISPSHYIKDRFNEFGFNNIELIPNTIEINNYPFKKRTHFEAKLLWVRSFKEIYNPLMAIKVAKKLMDTNVPTQLCMVGPDGDGTFLYARKEVRDLGIDASFTGKLTRKEWIALSKDYDIFVNTSYFDNMPVSLIEAMALGLSVISTNVGGIPFLVNKNIDAILVEPNDVEGMTNAIIDLLQNQNKAVEMASNGRRNAENFDWRIIKMQWRALLK